LWGTQSRKLDIDLNVMRYRVFSNQIWANSLNRYIRRLSTPMGSLSLSLKNALPCTPFPPRRGQAKWRDSTKWRSRGLVVGFREHPQHRCTWGPPVSKHANSHRREGTALSPSVPSAYCMPEMQGRYGKKR